MANNKLDDWQEVDDWQDMAEPANATRGPALAPREPVSKLKSAAAGVSQGLTMGYTPQIVGGLATAAGKIQDLLQGPVIDPATGKAIPRVNYVSARDSTVKDIDQAASDNPLTYMGGTIAGSLPAAKGIGAVASAPATVGGRLAAAAGTGAAQGFVSNPGDKEGVVDPAQLGERTGNAALAAFLNSTMATGGELVKKGARTARDIGTIKSGGMSDEAKGAIDSAVKNINEKQLAPRGDKLRELIQGKNFEVNPDRVESTFPRLAKAMKGNLAEGETRRALSPNRALRLKRAADASANYAQSKPFDPSSMAKEEDAKSLGDILRSQINAQPEAASLNDEMAGIIAKRDALSRSARNAPISAIRAKPGTDKDSLVKSIDQLAGSNLEGLDSRIGTARDLLLDPKNFVKPLEAMQELRKTATRGGAELSRALEKLPEGSKEATLQYILNRKGLAK